MHLHPQMQIPNAFSDRTCDILCQSDNRADILNPGKPRTSSLFSTHLRITEILTYFEMSTAAVERLVEGWNFGCTMQRVIRGESRKLTPTVKDLFFLACVAFCVVTFEPIMI